MAKKKPAPKKKPAAKAAQPPPEPVPEQAAQPPEPTPEPAPPPAPEPTPELIAVPWVNRMGHDIFHPDGPNVVAEVFDDPLLAQVKVTTFAANRGDERHPDKFLSVVRNGHPIDPIALVQQCLAEGKPTEEEPPWEEEPHARTYKTIRSAVIAFLRKGGDAWLGKDKTALVAREKLDERWEGDPQEAEELVCGFHREQAEKGTWPEVSHFDRYVFSREVPDTKETP